MKVELPHTDRSSTLGVTMIILSNLKIGIDDTPAGSLSEFTPTSDLNLLRPLLVQGRLK